MEKPPTNSPNKQIDIEDLTRLFMSSIHYMAMLSWDQEKLIEMVNLFKEMRNEHKIADPKIVDIRQYFRKENNRG